VTVEGEEEPIIDLIFEYLLYIIEYEAQNRIEGRNSKYSYIKKDVEYLERQFRGE